MISTIQGLHYPGYSHLHDTLSQMGSSISPVSSIMSVWWSILGFMFVLLGVSFYKSFNNSSKYIKLASWLFVFYGVGEGICSGVFPVNYNDSGFDFISMLHIILSGIGILAIMILPFVLQKIYIKKYFPLFYNYSFITVALGLVFIILFSLAKSIDNPENFLVQYKGLWQRALTINFYIYLTTLVVLMNRYRLDEKASI